MMMKKMMAVAMVCAMCFCSTIRAQETAETTVVPKDSETLKVQIAKLRGKLLYKKGQIRKIEKEACDSNAELKQKVDSLEKERRTQYIAANSKLEGLYAEQDTLETEIQKLSDEKDTLKKK